MTGCRRWCLLKTGRVCMVSVMTNNAGTYPSSAALAELAEEYFQTFLATHPLFAASLGFPGHDNEVGDPSREAERQEAAALQRLERRLAQIDACALNRDDRLTRSIMELRLRHEQGSLAAGMDEVSVSASVAGDLSMMLMLVPQASLTTPEKAEAYLQRLTALGRYFDALRRRYLQAKADGRVPIASGVRQAIQQLDTYLAADVRVDPLLRPTPPDGVDKDQWRGRAERILLDVVRPALVRLRRTWDENLLPVGRDDSHVGLCHVPGGLEGYRALVRLYTTTELSPDKIHWIGLEQVQRLREEIRDRGRDALGIGDTAEVLRHLRDDPSLRFESAEQIIDYANAAYQRATSQLPGWFRPYPVPECEIRPMDQHQAKAGSPGYYLWPSADGTRKGAFWINIHEPTQRPRATHEVMTFHETVPGHHLQATVGADSALPDFRRYRRSSAHAEGWGLYVEQLADEMGLYSSSLSRLGMLAEASWRACRLVIDTGLHHFGWSRAQAVTYLRDNTAQPEITVEAEIDRYIAMPAQALGYMIGQIRMQDMRRRAEQHFGRRFNIAEFHHRVIAEGSMPLDVLDEVIADWLSENSS